MPLKTTDAQEIDLLSKHHSIIYLEVNYHLLFCCPTQKQNLFLENLMLSIYLCQKLARPKLLRFNFANKLLSAAYNLQVNVNINVIIVRLHLLIKKDPWKILFGVPKREIYRKVDYDPLGYDLSCKGVFCLTF